MKSRARIISILFIVLVFFSCKKDQEVEAPAGPFDNLYGQWEWVYSFGGIAGQYINPDSVGYEVSIHFNSNGLFYYYRDDTLLWSDTYNVRELTGSNTFNYIIEYGDSQTYPDQFMELIKSDTLFLVDNCLDCYESLYVRN